MSDWEILPHPTDLRVRVRARDRPGLFESAALATFELCARPLRGWPASLETIEVEVRGEDEAGLLRSLLAECVYRFEAHGFLARSVHGVELDARRCRARLEGARFAPAELDVLHVIKAVTWHGLAIREERRAEGGGFVAEILYDL